MYLEDVVIFVYDLYGQLLSIFNFIIIIIIIIIINIVIIVIVINN